MAQFQSLEKEIRDIYNSLPNEYHFSPRAFQLRAYSPTRTSFIALHIYWHHCNCELYRLLNPGYREALPHAVIHSTSPDLVAYAQSNCLQHAVSVGEIVASTHGFVESELYISDIAQFVTLYQASCAILYACHRDSPAYSMDPEAARRYFTAFIATLSKSTQYFPRYQIYVQDIQNMLRSIDDPSSPLPVQKHATEVDFRARPLPEENSDGEGSTDPPRVATASTVDILPNRRVPQPAAVGMASATLPPALNVVPDIPAQQEVITPVDSHDFSWPYLGATEYGADAGTDQGLLWDWADALSTNFA